MGSDISRYVFLGVFIILASCGSRQRFKTFRLNPHNAVTVNVDKRIRFTAIDGVNYDFKSDKPYPVLMSGGSHKISIYFETQYKKDSTFRTEPFIVLIDLTKGLKYELTARDYKDREKVKGYDSKKETFLVHYYLKSDDGTIQIFKSSCNIEKIDLPSIRCLINNNENLDRRYGRNRDIAIIHHVVIKNLKDCLILLLDAGADPDRKSRAKGYTPLHYAAKQNRLDLVKILTEKKADVNIKDNEGQTPLHTAVIEGHYEIAEYLLKNGAKSNIRDRKGLRPYDYAKKSKNRKLRSLFVKKKVRSRALKEKKTVKHSAISPKKKKSIKRIVKKKPVKKVVKKILKVKKKRRIVKRKPRYEEDRLPKRKNPIPAAICSTQECYASISDKIESALRKKRYSRLESTDLRKVAYIYFQISKLCKRSTPDSAKEQFKIASELFRKMAFGKRNFYIQRRIIIKSAENHVTKGAKLIVEDADKKLKVLTE